jgi:uncharacterized protein DUF6941
MDVQLAVLADAANISQDGKLNILGEFDTIYAVETPAVWPVMFFVAKVKISEADGAHHRFELRVLNDDGQLVAPVATLEGESGPSPIPGTLGGGNLILGIRNARFPEYGTYTFELRGNNQRVCEVLVHVRPAVERPPARA